MNYDKKLPLFGVGDFLVVVFIVASLVLNVTQQRETGSEFELFCGDSLLLRTSLQDTTYSFDIENAHFSIEVTDSSTRFLENDCLAKICVHSRAIHVPGQEIICLPNKLVLRICGESEIEADVISR